LNRIEETEQIKEFWNDTEELSRVAYATDLLEKEKQIKKIDNELKLDVVAGKIIPISISPNGMTFDFIEFYNWAVSKGHELPPDINAYLTMSLNEFDEWCIKNNYSPPKRFAIARSKASQRVNVVSQEATEPASVKVNQVNRNDYAFSELLHKPSDVDDWFEIIDTMTKAFFLKYGAMPTKAQAWTQLCTNPPIGYGIKPDDGNQPLTMTGVIKPFNNRSFNRRWAKYTAESNPFKPN